MAGEAWSAERKEELERLWLQPKDGRHLTISEVALRMGLTRGQVLGQVRRMALIRSEALPRKRKVPKELVQAAGDQMAHGTRWREQRFRPEAPKVSIPEPVAVGALRIRADDLCCFPFGTPRTPDFRFCCEPVVAGRPYCAVHMAVAYVHVQPYQVDDDYDR